MPVNSNTAHCPPHPGHLTGFLLRTVENLTQNEARQVGHLTVVSKRWSASQAKGSRNSFIPHVHLIHESLLLYSLHCFVGAFESLWKSPSNVGSLEWPILWKWRNLRKTAFLDLREFPFCLLRYLTLNKRFDKWENFWIISCGYVGDFTRFEALAGGAFNHLNCQHTREFNQNFSKKPNAQGSPRRGGHGRFLMFHYIQFHYI